MPLGCGLRAGDRRFEVTDHAAQRMAERRISVAQAEAALAKPRSVDE
ncbi:MAG: DUF4258 domain-containing protein [Sporichthyaceae bacterium]